VQQLKIDPYVLTIGVKESREKQQPELEIHEFQSAGVTLFSTLTPESHSPKITFNKFLIKSMNSA